MKYNWIKRSLIIIIILCAVMITGVAAAAQKTDDPAYIFEYAAEDYSVVTTKITLRALIDTPLVENGVYAYYAVEVGGDFDEYVRFQNEKYDKAFPNATRLSDATTLFNSHSYAWYSQDVETNRYWIPTPINYTECDYEEVETPQIGDVICYLYSRGTPSDADDEIVHSGIVVGISDQANPGIAGEYVVKSKWGTGGVYSHNGYECPYTAFADGKADYVKFYRLKK